MILTVLMLMNKCFSHEASRYARSSPQLHAFPRSNFPSGTWRLGGTWVGKLSHVCILPLALAARGLRRRAPTDGPITSRQGRLWLDCRCRTIHPPPLVRQFATLQAIETPIIGAPAPAASKRPVQATKGGRRGRANFAVASLGGWAPKVGRNAEL